MGCGVTFVKYVLFFFNLLFALAGLAILGLGVAVKLQISEITQIIEQNQIDIAPTLSIVVGSIIFVIAFYGCCGAIRESNCMLVLYSIFLIILIIAQVVLASLIFMYLPEARNVTTEWLNKTFQDNSAESTAAFNNLQTALKCCGTSGPLSYVSVALPSSCCAGNPQVCPVISAYQTGCIEVVTDFLTGFGGAIGGVVIAVAAIEVVGVVFSLCLANHARNMERRW